MNNIVIVILSVIVILALFIVLYQKNKVKEFYNILNELSEGNGVGKYTELYISKTMLNIEYILNNKSKMKAFPLLEEAYSDEFRFLAEINLKKELSDKQKDRLITILQSKLTSNMLVTI